MEIAFTLMIYGLAFGLFAVSFVAILVVAKEFRE
jgi:hypothetical protein